MRYRPGMSRRSRPRLRRSFAPLLALGACAAPATRNGVPNPPELPVPVVATNASPAPSLDSDLRPAFAELGLPPRSQGPRPTCSIFTTVAALEFACARATGHGERLSTEFCNWAANAANGRHDDGDFFHFALSGYERYGICPEAMLPYAGAFDAQLVPSPDALVAAGRLLGGTAPRLHVRWIRPGTGTRGLDDAQFADVLATLAAGWPVAAGSAHSRLLVGYRADPSAPGGGVFYTLDSALARFAEVTAEYVHTDICDAFAVEVAPAGT